MASLVEPLAAGVSTAPSGTATFYLEGTSTLAPVYSDAHGMFPVTTHVLDATGSIVRYIEARVDVVVKDAFGATVRTFTAGSDARESRVENLGFTGTDEFGATVPGGRTTVDEVLSSLYASFGGVDGNVIVGGVGIPIYAAVASSTAVFYVVTAYGAVGDGVTDDTTAIQTAINTAVANGGGTVVFPSLTYKISASLTSAANVNFLGLGVATLTATSGGAGFFRFTSATNHRMDNLTFVVSGAIAATIISVEGASRVFLIGCIFPTTGTAQTQVKVSHASAEALCIACKFTVPAVSCKAADATVSGARMQFIGCNITDNHATGVTFAFDGVAGTSIELLGCRYLGTSTATYSAVLGSGAYSARIGGGHYTFSGAGGSFYIFGGSGIASMSGALIEQTTASTCLLTVNTGSSFVESGCQFLNTGGGTIDPGVSANIRSQWRQSRIATTYTGAWTSGILPNAQYHLAYYNFTSATPASITISPPGPNVDCGIGEYFTMIIRHGSGGGGVTVNWNAAYLVPTGFTTIASGAVFRMMFMRTAAAEYTCVSSQAT